MTCDMVVNVEFRDDDAMEVEEVDNTPEGVVRHVSRDVDSCFESRNDERERTRRKRRKRVGREVAGSPWLNGGSNLEGREGGMSGDEGEELVGKEREGYFEGGQVDEVGENRSKSVAAGLGLEC